MILCALCGMAAVAVSLAAAAGGQQPSEAPRFRSSVDVTTLDASVIDRSGRPITNLGAEAFSVRIDGRARRVVRAEWISPVRSKELPATPVPEGYTTNENAADGRAIVIVVDQANIREGHGQAVMATASAFVDKLLPSDRIAVVSLGIPAPSTELTANRTRVKDTLAQMGGQKRDDLKPISDHNIATTEAIAITGGDMSTLNEVVGRECRALLRSSSLASCRAQVEMEAGRLERDEALKSDATLTELGELFLKLEAIDGPKTLILVSEGLAYNDIASRVDALATLAARARTNIDVLRLDDPNFVMANRFGLPALAPEDKFRNDGLQMLAVATQGAVFNVIGTGSDFFDRLQAELSGYYLIGVESEPGDRDGRPHPIQIDVLQRDVIVRSRRQMVNPGGPARAPGDAIAVGLSSPSVLKTLPLRVATFSLRGSDPEKVQLLIHAEVGHDYSASTPVVIGYRIADSGGRIVETRAVEGELAPALSGFRSALQFVGAASVAPGKYTLKLVAAEGERSGSVEHVVYATLADAGSVKFSELLVGGPVDARDGLTPVVGYTVKGGSVRGYIEAYVSQASVVSVAYEIAVDSKSPALLSASVPERRGADGRQIFVLSMPVNRLPPGTYVLRAAVSADAKRLDTFTRPFELVAPSLRTTSGDPSPAGSPLSLAVDQREFMQPFRRDEALTPAVLKPFRDRVAASIKTDFETGLAYLAAKDYPQAEITLKRAVRPEVDSTSALTYLAVTFAAAGHDTEAAAAWQTALAEGSDLPQIYEWLSAALLRTRRLVDARMILEEAADRWPSDARFMEPLAKLYATLGEGSEALAMLERYLAARPNDSEGFRFGIEWIYQAHAAGRVVRGGAEDLTLARAYADAYSKANGPERALVGQWLEFLEREKH